MPTIKEWYERVNAAWPDPTPKVTEDEAVRAARKLWRFATGSSCPYPIKVTSGRRYTYTRGGTLYVNTQRGWHGLVHELSHDLHRRLYQDRPHGKSHARLELKLIKEVIRRGWLDGTLKTPERPPPAPKPDDRIERRQAQVVRLERKIKALTTRVKRARRSLAALTRAAEKAQTKG